MAVKKQKKTVKENAMYQCSTAWQAVTDNIQINDYKSLSSFTKQQFSINQFLVKFINLIDNGKWQKPRDVY